MKDADKTREQFVEELKELRQRVAELTKLETDQTQVKEALRRSEVKYRNMVESSPDWIWTCDLEGRQTFANRAVKRLLGYEVHEILGASAFSLMHPQDRERIKKSFKSAVEQKRGWKNTVIRWLHKDGSVRLLETSARQILEKEGALVGYSGIDRDITDRREAEDALRKSEHYYRVLLTKLHEDIIVIDRNYRITDANNTFLETVGLRREEVIGRLCYEVSHGYDEPCNLKGEECVFEEVFETGEPRACLHEHRKTDGSKVWVDILMSPLKDEKWYVTHVIEAVRDVTYIMRVDEELREQKEILENILAASPIAIGLAEHRIIKWTNEAWLEIFGFDSQEEFLGKSTRIIYPTDEEYLRIGDMLRQTFPKEKVVQADVKLARKDGSVFDGFMKLSSMDPSDPLKRVIATFVDVSSR